MSEISVRYETNNLQDRIVQVRGVSVILDSDLAHAYGVTTKRLNEQISRNRKRFPSDFVFRLTRRECSRLKAQLDGLRSQHADNQSVTANRSQIATGSSKHRDPRFMPYAFTEHGAIMAAMVLNSPKAVQMSVYVVRAFVAMRSLLVSQQGLAKKLAELEHTLTERLDTHEHAISDVIQQIMQLLTPPPPEPEPARPRIGFGVRERRARYRVRCECGRQEGRKKA